MGELDLRQLLASPEVQAAGGLLLALVIGYAIVVALTGALVRAAARTETELDDHLIAILRRPVIVMVAALAFEWAADLLRLRSEREWLFDGLVGTLCVAVWVVALVRVADEVLLELHRRPGSWLRGRASGLLRYMVRIAVLGVGAYALVLVWGGDVGAWGVSAGVVGVVLAFAAQDSLGNLISGLFIIADRPLQIGDFVQIEGELRGRVTDIGWRSTRFLTNDGVEVNYPNAKLSEARVVNESAGPFTAIRVWCEFPVEYGRAPEEIAALVLPGAESLPDVVAEPAPRLFFLGPTTAGLRFALLVHVGEPHRQRDAQDAVNCHVYAALRAARVGFAVPTHAVALGGPQVEALRAALERRA